jgi:Protein of unknown function (DUF4058)
MPSPFPGVDPFLEASGHWEGFHERIIIYLSDMLSERLPRPYWVNIQERVTSIALPDEYREQFVADVGVSSLGETGAVGELAAEAVATMEPVPMQMLYQEPTRESYLEILRLPDRELVTVIEILSPSNKEMPGRELYTRKREAIQNQYVNLVEIDFLKRGSRLPTKEPLPVGDYFAFVARAQRRPITDTYAWSVRREIPPIRIPLKEPDPDIAIALGQVWKQAFDRGRYEEVLNYSADPPSFLRPADRDWAREIVAGRV